MAWHAEVVGLAPIHRPRCGRGIDLHVAHRTAGVSRSRSLARAVDLVGARIHPALALILHVVGGLRGYLTAEVALHDSKREIDSARQTARAGEVARIDEARTTHQLHVRELHG